MPAIPWQSAIKIRRVEKVWFDDITAGAPYYRVPNPDSQRFQHAAPGASKFTHWRSFALALCLPLWPGAPKILAIVPVQFHWQPVVQKGPLQNHRDGVAGRVLNYHPSQPLASAHVHGACNPRPPQFPAGAITKETKNIESPMIHHNVIQWPDVSEVSERQDLLGVVEGFLTIPRHHSRNFRNAVKPRPKGFVAGRR